MSERRIVADNLEIRYEGIFDFKELCKMIDDWQKQHGYDRHDMKNFEQVFKDGRDIEIEMQPWKKINEDEKIVIKVILLVKKMKDITVKADGHDMKMNQGQIHIKMAAFLVTDLSYKWEGKTYVHFLRNVVDKWVWRLPIAQHEGMAGGEATDLYTNIRSHLNLYRRKTNG